jgi:Calcium binding
MKRRRRRVRVAKVAGGLAIIRRQARPREDSVRENRITMEVVVDAHDGSERATGWYCYLSDQLEFPFTAGCIQPRAISPLQVGDEVEVISMAPEDECAREMFVMIRWEHGGLGVPLSQLKPTTAGLATTTAVGDWHYWVRRGYQL